jgi:hypothetical protein
VAPRLASRAFSLGSGTPTAPIVSSPTFVGTAPCAGTRPRRSRLREPAGSAADVRRPPALACARIADASPATPAKDWLVCLRNERSWRSRRDRSHRF